MDIKEKRKQYYIDNRDRIIERNKQYYYMDLIQGIWPAWLGLEKRDFKFTGTGASSSVTIL